MIVSTLFPVCTIILMSCIFIFTQKSALLCSVFFSRFSYTLSDTNLNYVQVLLFFVWGFSCCKVSSIFCIFSIDRSTSGNILDLTSSECSFLAYVNVTDWMGFRYENECGLTGFISIRGIFVL